MRILIVHYSRSGHTARLAARLTDEIRQRGHAFETEVIRVKRDWNKWLLPIPLLPLLPLLPLYLMSARFRLFWHGIYRQQEQAILPLLHPDVSGFDLVLLGTPKWLYLSYPVARWLNTAQGLDGKRVATFATFCGPPLQVFEIGMLFDPMEARLRSRGAEPAGRLAISSDYHPYFFFDEMRRVFHWLSLKAFGRSLSDFTLDGEVGQAGVKRFCDQLLMR
ncbi:MAG TPA: hypothetical protein PLE48_10335 [Thiobacillus sp.]|nr:hypothetical protein [Thiobacillus sp.]HQT70810.1 hypothetical protein [Thiobacillus sp.]